MTTRSLDADSRPIRLGHFTAGGPSRGRVTAAALAFGIVPAGIGVWYAITGRDALAVLHIAIGAALAVIGAVSLMLVRRMDAGGSVDPHGVRIGRRRLAWSEVSRLRIHSGGGRELLAVCRKGSNDLLFIGATTDAAIDRDEVLRRVEEWAGRPIEPP
jgi:hypothetical protein